MQENNRFLSGLFRWRTTQRLLRVDKRSEILSSRLTREQQNTQLVLGVLLEFGRTSGLGPDRVEEFLQRRCVEVDFTPNFQWENGCVRNFETGLGERSDA